MKHHELRDRKATQVRRQLMDVWNVDPQNYWYPLAPSARTHRLAFHAAAFHDMWSSVSGVTILREHGIEQVFELREGGAVFQLPVDDLDPVYTGDEGYWSSATFDWIIYASHESSITVSGKWFVARVKSAWPLWKMYMWTLPLLG